MKLTPERVQSLVPVADLPGRRTLRSGVSSRLLMPPTRRSTAGDRVWNTLPEEITTSQSLPTFCQRLKTLALQEIIPGHHRDLNQPIISIYC